MDQQLCLSFVGRSLSWGMECCLKNLGEKFNIHVWFAVRGWRGEEHAQEQGWSEHLVVAHGQGRAVRFMSPLLFLFSATYGLFLEMKR